MHKGRHQYLILHYGNLNIRCHEYGHKVLVLVLVLVWHSYIQLIVPQL